MLRALPPSVRSRSRAPDTRLHRRGGWPRPCATLAAAGTASANEDSKTASDPCGRSSNAPGLAVVFKRPGARATVGE